MKTLSDFINVLQGLVATLHSNFPKLYSRDFIVSSATEFQLVQNAPEETNKSNGVSKRCLRIREMVGVTVAVAHARLYEDTVKYYQMVQGEKSAKMFLNNLGCNNNGKRYSQNRRWLRMVNKKSNNVQHHSLYSAMVPAVQVLIPSSSSVYRNPLSIQNRHPHIRLSPRCKDKSKTKKRAEATLSTVPFSLLNRRIHPITISPLACVE